MQGPRRSRSGPESPAPAQLTPRPLGTPPAGLPPAVGRLLASPGPGEPLPTAVQEPIAERLGVDPRAVRVHAGPDATDAADLLQARAFAYGNHIFVGRGQRISDLSLMAHEVAHVVQQQGGAVVQRAAFAGSPGGLELEAQAAGAAVASGRSARVVGRTAAPRVQGSFLGAIGRGLSAVGGAIVSGVQAVGHAVAELGAAALNAALNFIKEHARSIPGYELLSFILGRDPITQQPVERTAVNLIRGLVSFIPGGTEMFDNIQRSGVLQKAADWFTTEVAKLDLSWERIRGLFKQAWDALSPSDILSPSTAWEKIKRIFGPPVGRLIDFAVSAGRKLLEFIFEGAIALGGAGAQQVLGFFRRIQSVFSLIVSDPVKFLKNLLDAVKGGFRNFAAHIIDHLRQAIFQWLLGALAGVVRLPARFDFMGIVDVVLQVLGLTYERFRERLVRLLGDPAVRFIEQAFDFLKTLITQGIAAAWHKLLDFATGLVDTAVGMIRDWVSRQIVTAAVTKLVTMFNPVGAIIQSIITVYNTVMFFIEKGREVVALINSVVDSIDNIARGNIAGAVAYVERMLAQALVVLLGFLARWVGLGRVGDAVRDTIRGVQATVWAAVDRVVEWVRTSVAALLGRRQEGATAGAPGALPEAEFDESGEHHRLYFAGEGATRVPTIASTPEALLEFLSQAEHAGLPNAQKAELGTARGIVGQMGTLASRLANASPTDQALTAERAQLATLESQLAPILKRILSDVDLKTFNEIYLLEGVVGQYAQMPSQRRDRLTPDHQPQASLLEFAAENVRVSPGGASVFAGLTLESASSGHGRGGMTINVHHTRHVKGRTYGGKSASTLGAVRPRILAITTMPLTPEEKRKAVVPIFRGELQADVTAMLGVVSPAETDAIWQDTRDYNLRLKRKAKVDALRQQIRAGLQALLGQDLDRYTR